MALSSILRRSASQLTPLTIRAIGFQRYSHQCAALFAAVKHSDISGKLFQSSFPPVLHYSTKKPSSDESLLRVIESEIKCAEESDDHDQVEEAPEGFPFKLQDNTGQQTISLTREYQGETINVEVHMPDLITGEENDDDGDNNDDTERGMQSSTPLVVRVSKKDGPCLEFGCTAYPDEISIDSLSVKDPNAEDQIAYEGPDFSDLDENLQKAFHKYLEIRGIKPSTTNYLHEYMINKDSREYLIWLKNLKKFIAA
ncbi:unnamed protein product [Ilex paraguariensis]|uniref:Mitochondrial glycoprotein n=1 Tax=Ilex paraguariensis TaxID=185542 RepID=A0ABC8QVU8_9AQUA